MSDRLAKLDYYTLLAIPDDATPDVIQNAFHEFALRYHPDRHVGSPPDKIERANEIYRRGAEAYRVLLDPQARAEYDQGLKEGRLRFGAAEVVSRPTTGSSQRVAKRAQPYLDKAREALKSGSLNNARVNLQIALSYDREHPQLMALLAEVESKLTKK